MRGIVGVIRFTPAGPALAPMLELMLTAMAGPSDRTPARKTVSADACLAATATPVVPEDSSDSQPLALPEGAWLVTSARLRNREDLAAQFAWPSSSLRDRADSEFVAEAYLRWGEQCPAHLEGPFALAVWQPAARRLFGATDRVASSPLYFAEIPGGVAFASTLNALFALPGRTARLNRSAFAAYLANIPTDEEETFYEGISRLRGGHALTFEAGAVRTWRYREPIVPPLLELANDADYVAALREQLTAAVRRSLRPMGGQVGLLLSGGLDSSAVAAVAGRLLADEGRRLQCIHILPRGSDRYGYSHTELDETRYARSLQAFAPHIDFHFVETVSEPAPRAAWAAYFAENRAPFESLLSRDSTLPPVLERLDVRLLLDGVGGNHILSLEALPSGYLAHLALTGQWATWWHESRAHSRLHGRPWRTLLRHTAINPWKQRLRGGPPAASFADSPLRFLHPSIRASCRIDERKRAFRARWSSPPVDLRARLTATVHEWTTLSLTPRASVCPAEPTRHFSCQPLYDRRLNAFCLSVPLTQHVRDGWDRRLLREAMRGLLPDEIRLRVTRGLMQPEFQSNLTAAAPLLQAELAQLGSSALERELLDCTAIRHLAAQGLDQPSLRHDQLLVKTLVAAAFLRWHEQNGGR